MVEFLKTVGVGFLASVLFILIGVTMQTFYMVFIPILGLVAAVGVCFGVGFLVREIYRSYTDEMGKRRTDKNSR